MISTLTGFYEENSNVFFEKANGSREWFAKEK